MKHSHSQQGFSLIEVLVAVLILSFGMLALGAMLSFSVQLPKLAGYRATASNLAASHVERMRANPVEFQKLNNRYTAEPLSYDGTFNPIEPVDCIYDTCTPAALAAMDNAATQRAVRMALPAGGMLVTCDTSKEPCSATSYGNIWIIWQDPSTAAALDSASSGNCPVQVTQRYTSPAPRCLYVRFKI